MIVLADVKKFVETLQSNTAVGKQFITGYRGVDVLVLHIWAFAYKIKANQELLLLLDSTRDF